MTTEQVRLFADYILGMDKTAGDQYVQFSACRLDETFFEELKQMIGEARNQGDTARQGALDSLMRTASQVRGRASAQFTANEATPQPQNDHSRAMRLIELDKRVTSMMMRTWFNPVTAAVIADWKNVLDGYRGLLKAGPPKTAYYTLESVTLKVAQTLDSLARAYESMRDAEHALSYYKQASAAFKQAGSPDDAARCRRAGAQDQLSEEADFDGQIRGLLQGLESLRHDSPEYCTRLVELGELQLRAGDDFAAEKTLLNAEADLNAAKLANPTGADLANALTQTLMGLGSSRPIPAATNIQTSMQVRSLHQRIHLALAEAYQGLNRPGDAAEATRRLQLADEMDSRKSNDEFSAQMLKALCGGLGGLLR